MIYFDSTITIKIRINFLKFILKNDQGDFKKNKMSKNKKYKN